MLRPKVKDVSTSVEPRWLAEQMDALSPAEFEMSRNACEQMASALWRGLDGVMLEIEKQH